MSTPVAVVTGAAGGIGRAVVARFRMAGYRMVLVDRPGIEFGLEEDHDTRFFAGDLADPVTADAAIAAACSEFGGVDVLVNNAGIGGSRSVLDTEDEAWARILDVNLGSVFRLSRAALRVMVPRREGAIIHVSSIFGLVGYQGTAAYAASKAGIVGLTRQMAADYGVHGIRVNAVAPGLIETEMTQNSLKDPTYRDLMLRGIPLSRLGRPEDVANAIFFLATKEASFISGEVLTIDGGWRATRVRTVLE